MTQGVVVQGIVDNVRGSGGSILLADSMGKISFNLEDILPELTGEIPEGTTPATHT